MANQHLPSLYRGKWRESYEYVPRRSHLADMQSMELHRLFMAHKLMEEDGGLFLLDSDLSEEDRPNEMHRFATICLVLGNRVPDCASVCSYALFCQVCSWYARMTS